MAHVILGCLRKKRSVICNIAPFSHTGHRSGVFCSTGELQRRHIWLWVAHWKPKMSLLLFWGRVLCWSSRPSSHWLQRWRIIIMYIPVLLCTLATDRSIRNKCLPVVRFRHDVCGRAWLNRTCPAYPPVCVCVWMLTTEQYACTEALQGVRTQRRGTAIVPCTWGAREKAERGCTKKARSMASLPHVQTHTGPLSSAFMASAGPPQRIDCFLVTPS
jgi:hypothetical protein